MIVLVYIPSEEGKGITGRTLIDATLMILSLKRAALRLRATMPLASTPRSTCFYKYLSVMQYVIVNILRVVET